MHYNKIHRHYDRRAAGRWHSGGAAAQGQFMLQVELDVRPGPPGPSPLSSSSSNSPSSSSSSADCSLGSNSCITIVAGESAMQPHLTRTSRTPLRAHVLWRQRAEDALWLASAFFILFYGDFRSNFFSLLASDPRILRAPLAYGTACLLLNCTILAILLMARSYLKHSGTWVPAKGITMQGLEKYITAVASAAFAALGLAAFAMLSIALWPVWYILTFPLLFTLFMAMVVLSSYALQPWSSLMTSQRSACAAYTNKDSFINAWSVGDLRSSFRA